MTSIECIRFSRRILIHVGQLLTTPSVTEMSQLKFELGSSRTRQTCYHFVWILGNVRHTVRNGFRKCQ